MLRCFAFWRFVQLTFLMQIYYSYEKKKHCFEKKKSQEVLEKKAF